jgi:lysophospholipase L1-like esterase
MDFSNNYTKMVSDNLGLTPINYGIISSTIADFSDTTGDNPMCYRYIDMDNEADVITVFAGVNDSASKLGNPNDRTPIDSLYGACHTLFSGLASKYPGKKIGIISPCQHARCLPTDTEYGAPDIDLAKLRSKVDVIKEVSAYYSLPFLDLFRSGGMNGFVTEHRNTFWQADKLHLTTAGHQVIARRIENFIRSF